MQGEMLDIQLGVNRTPVDISLDVERGGSYYSPLPTGGSAGDLLAKRTNTDYDVEWVTPATNAEQDNTRPITAAAVYTEIGNINALLATI